MIQTLHFPKPAVIQHNRPPRLFGGSRYKQTPINPKRQLREAKASRQRAVGGAPKYAGRGTGRYMPSASPAAAQLHCEAWADGAVDTASDAFTRWEIDNANKWQRRNTMAMSKDVVVFKLALSTDQNRNRIAVRAAIEAFKLNMMPSGRLLYEEHHIICRPSQFVRFLILRNNYGGTNGFKELAPALMDPCQVVISTNAARLDVSQNRDVALRHNEVYSAQPNSPFAKPLEVSMLGRTTLQLFLKALGEAYPNDFLEPGVVVAYLHKEQTWYASIKRHSDKGAYTIVGKRQGTTLELAVLDLMKAWQGMVSKPAKSSLVEFTEVKL